VPVFLLGLLLVESGELKSIIGSQNRIPFGTPPTVGCPVGTFRSVSYSFRIVASEEGHTIVDSDGHSENGERAYERLEPDSNVTVERDLHLEKHSLSRRVTEAGMQIDETDEQERKAKSWIAESLEPDSKVTAERESHPKKQDSPSLSREEGRQIDESEEQQ
jgi:hypothetical protein